ncbi:MAG: hypothetical protein PHF46_01315 [Candidatus Gracilibacteria bacterium]|nr:hypothetical protein [Candidatus Gracilibacteria bacterium]
MIYNTNYRFIDGNNNGIILTHGMFSSIESNSLKQLENFFVSKNFSVLLIDLYAHGKTRGKIEDVTLTKCYKQILNGVEFLKEKGVKNIYLYGTSFSSLPILKAGLKIGAKLVILKTPIIDYYKKRLNDIGLDKMKKWQKDGIINVGINHINNENVYQKYEFIKDYLNNFKDLFQNRIEIPVFVAGGLYDDEINIEDLRFIKRTNKNFLLKEYAEKHKFSENGINILINDINALLFNS